MTRDTGAMPGPTENLWVAALRNNPDHARNYAERWSTFVAEGRDIYGEARTIDAMVDRRARILDAGCGTGRIGGWLAERGHDVTGVDLDDTLIDVAKRDWPKAIWEVQNLAELNVVDDSGIQRQFDIVVSAGNVMTFLAESERMPALVRIQDHLAPTGRFVVGFSSGRDYDFEEFEADAFEAGMEIQQRYSTWTLRPPAVGFLVAVLAPVGGTSTTDSVTSGACAGFAPSIGPLM